METQELIFKIIELTLQLVLVIFAGFALYAWKIEVRGKDKYFLAKELLIYIKDLRFWVFSKTGSVYQISLNDILINKKRFYEEQLFLIKNERAYFDNSAWGLFKHIDTRGDLFLPKNIRLNLEKLYPSSGKKVGHKGDYTYIQVVGAEKINNKEIEEENNIIYELAPSKELTIGEYFQRWEKLVVELKKIT